MSVLAVDIGGTKLAVAIVDRDGHLVRSATAPTPPDPWPALQGLLEEVVGDEPLSGVGIGCGGPFSWPDGRVSPLNIPGWRDFPLRAQLAQRYPGVPVRLHNDAVCMAVGEHFRGAARGIDDALGMVVSTGIGGGLILGGRLLDGPSGNAGHVGHLVAEPAGPACACGGRGCLEAVASGPSTVAWARARGCEAEDGRALAARAAEGDPIADAALARAGAAVGRAAASTAALLDLRLVVVGGGLAQSGPPFWDPLTAAFTAQAQLAYLSGARVLPAELGPSAGLVGAAALVLAGERYWSPAA
ncbi:MAG TPA: ROK family protein [Mycobacteriales bacterium]|nr:ROK family protein [Mycobacteriales bacterium]